MPKNLLFISILLSLFALQAQSQLVNDSVSMNAGYVNQSWYSLADGETKNELRLTWDLAFDVSPRGYAVRSNGSSGVEVYVYPGDTSDFLTLDTTGISSWVSHYNSDTNWDFGAFTKQLTGFQVGWGTYNFMTHDVTGDSLYVLKLPTGDWVKLWIQALDGGGQNWHFRYAALDNSTDVTESMAKSTYPNRNFVYYSIGTGSFVNREPDFNTWDITFDQYMVNVGIWYPVVGVLQNRGVDAVCAYPIADPSTYSAHASHSFESQMNQLGHDWKNYNMTSMMWELEDSTIYFVKTKNGNIWRMFFTGYEGASTGKIQFSKEQVYTSSINANRAPLLLDVYPNPVNDFLHLTLNSDLPTEWMLFGIDGKVITSGSINKLGLSQTQLDFSGFESGNYILTLTNSQGQSSQQIFIH